LKSLFHLIEANQFQMLRGVRQGRSENAINLLLK